MLRTNYFTPVECKENHGLFLHNWENSKKAAYYYYYQRKIQALLTLSLHSLWPPFSLSEAQRKYEDNCDSLHEESVSETAENSGEEAGEGALDVEAGEMTDGGEDDYDEEGSHHLVRETVDRPDRGEETKALWEISSGQTVFAF